MAIVLPLLVVFILVLVDFGTAIDRREVIQHAVYEGSRKGAVGASVADIKSRAVAQSQGLLTDSDISVCYLDSDANGMLGNAGDDVRVSANFTYKFSIGGGETLTAWSVPVPQITMTPHADSRLENSVVGTGLGCPP